MWEASSLIATFLYVPITKVVDLMDPKFQHINLAKVSYHQSFLIENLDCIKNIFFAQALRINLQFLKLKYRIIQSIWG